MSETTVVAVVTIVLVILPLLWALSGWFSRRSSRAMLRGLGLALIPVGLVLTGLMRLLVRAIHLVVDWFAGTAMTTTTWIGVIAIAVGLVAWFAAGFMSPVDRETGRQRRQDHIDRKQARSASQGKSSRSTGISAPNPTGSPTPGVTPGATPSQAASGTQRTPTDAPVRMSKPTAHSKTSASAADKDEDAELEEILRKRGIE
ncbi:hypothetical protein E5345_11165 [Propionibacterium sp. NM47_B9-13]|jgi:hypothetical protein|uniref:Cellulose synthase n=2 Tax=Cutibacterium modestum TaxID=2559073 RepID=A0AAD1KPK7_9ACTN|nr:hypothetical protein [Cutibacterium modestum]TGY28027.1 hypothetical protein E5345_11165 [Propionibacterium sp. NM47_B9-13]AOH46415.1 hypothetical protein BCB70_11415 [Cutibacterium modestum]EFS74294.1 hypothetical protein HMPREF9621_01326 [Cutibacterium modestum HL037PA2]EFS91921.1 hypothetical protein HMPREF9607_01895 [Cutibacterium modestum HL044PA1]EFT16187.1 hypothetical protein HMPREF9622_00749 [Cutibacterium modestum HL037PA3]